LGGRGFKVPTYMKEKKPYDVLTSTGMCRWVHPPTARGIVSRPRIQKMPQLKQTWLHWRSVDIKL
jgi:hypothetical protein